MNHIIACYDIHEPKRLLRVAKVMKNYGERVLKSVFECDLSESKFESMKAGIDGLIDHQEDSVRFYFLCKKCRKQIKISGLGVRVRKESSFIIT